MNIIEAGEGELMGKEVIVRCISEMQLILDEWFNVQLMQLMQLTKVHSYQGRQIAWKFMYYAANHYVLRYKSLSFNVNLMESLERF